MLKKSAQNGQPAGLVPLQDNLPSCARRRKPANRRHASTAASSTQITHKRAASKKAKGRKSASKKKISPAARRSRERTASSVELLGKSTGQDLAAETSVQAETRQEEEPEQEPSSETTQEVTGLRGIAGTKRKRAREEDVVHELQEPRQKQAKTKSAGNADAYESTSQHPDIGFTHSNQHRSQQTLGLGTHERIHDLEEGHLSTLSESNDTQGEFISSQVERHRHGGDRERKGSSSTPQNLDSTDPAITDLETPHRPATPSPERTPARSSAKPQVKAKEPSPEDSWPIVCICQTTYDDCYTACCNACDTLQHIDCYYDPVWYVPPGADGAPVVRAGSFKHYCVVCRPPPADDTIYDAGYGRVVSAQRARDIQNVKPTTVARGFSAFPDQEILQHVYRRQERERFGYRNLSPETQQRMGLEPQQSAEADEGEEIGEDEEFGEDEEIDEEEEADEEEEEEGSDEEEEEEGSDEEEEEEETDEEEEEEGTDEGERADEEEATGEHNEINENDEIDGYDESKDDTDDEEYEWVTERRPTQIIPVKVRRRKAPRQG